MKKFIYILAVTFLFTACDQERDIIVFDTENGQTFVSFEGSSANLSVLIDDTGSIDIPINITTTAATDRVFTVSVVPELTTADPATYSVGLINIPGDSFTGTLTVDGVDMGVETTPETIVLQIDEQPGIVASSATFTISMFQICPVPEGAFTGNYLIEQLNPILGTFGVHLFESQIVTISPGTGGVTSRFFEAVYIEALAVGQPASTITFNLACNEVVVEPGIDTFLFCDPAAPTITLGPATTPSLYDATDDSYFELTLTDLVTDGDCGGAPYEVTFGLTKQ